MDEPVEVVAGVLARQLDVRLAVAESCTGGLIGHLLTNVPGSSDYFLGGIISYANQTKIDLLGIKPETLALYGAVSRDTVVEMARGVRQRLSADIGVSVSGIAGPGGDTPGKPIGTTWIGLSVDGMDRAWLFQFTGERQEIKRRAAEMALNKLVEYFKEEISFRTVPLHDS